jgi:hypothetical protein
MEEVAKHAKLFEEAVETYPETIACRNQNLPLGKFYWPNDDKWDSPSLEKYKMGTKKLKMLSGYESKCMHSLKKITLVSSHELQTGSNFDGS